MVCARMTYKIIIHPEAVKEIAALDGSVRLLVFKQIKKLSHMPGLGAPLGNKMGMDLSGFRCIRHRVLGFDFCCLIDKGIRHGKYFKSELMNPADHFDFFLISKSPFGQIKDLAKVNHANESMKTLRPKFI